MAGARRDEEVERRQKVREGIEVNGGEVVLSDAEVPLALAEAISSGNFRLMDYMKLKNIQADTTMRKNLGKQDDPTQ